MGTAEERTEQRARADREELVERLLVALPSDGRIEPLEGLHLQRGSSCTELVYGETELSFCVIAQGSKEIHIGNECFRYDPAHYLLTTVDLPAVGRLVAVSPERPYLSVRVVLDPALVSSVMMEAGGAFHQGSSNTRAINVSPIDGGLLDATVRLVRLLDSPAETHMIAPLVMREIVCRLLMGEQGGRLRHMAVLGGYTNHIALAVVRIRNSFDKPLRIERLAKEMGMSNSCFHQRFKAVTALTPLQFQKQLRLQEARRLMLSEDMDAASAGYRVGYGDAAHFSREYKQFFGLPPMRDKGRIKGPAQSLVNNAG